MVQIIRRTGKRKPLPTIEIEPQEYRKREIKGRICTFDTETDPFAEGRIVKPFTCGHYFTDTGEYIDFWGDNCIDQYVKWLSQFEEGALSIFVHNGGNFDFYFMTDYFDDGQAPFIINGRLVRLEIAGQEFRDSYAMIPVALAAYDKMKVDYRMMERGFREVYKDFIREYQKDDCIKLGELVTNWLDMFGNKLTMAGVALPMLRSFHGFDTINEKLDSELRPFYFGGRNQCFATGIMEGDFKVYDINSSYPNVMRSYKHPIGDLPIYGTKINEKTDFAFIRAHSLGALPVRAKGGGLDFPIGTQDFFACIHEIRAGLETKTLKIYKVYHTIEFSEKTTFAEFIDTFYALRIEAGDSGDDIKKLFYKLVMNSSYGKFAQDPRKYENFLFNPSEVPKPLYCNTCFENMRAKNGEPLCASCLDDVTNPHGWYLHTSRDAIQLYASPQKIRPGNFFNVATAASITSAARAELLRGIKAATRPLYCDTDSLICEALDCNDTNGLVMSEKALGGWKLEAQGDTVVIAGKKLYAVFDKGDTIKQASKGVRLTAREIERVARGETIEYASPVPKFSLDGNHKFITRKIARTA